MVMERFWLSIARAGRFGAAILLTVINGAAPRGDVHGRSLSASQAYTTLDLSVPYHKPITRNTGSLRAEGRVRSLGKRVGFAEASLTDAEGQLYAPATSTLLVFDRAPGSAKE